MQLNIIKPGVSAVSFYFQHLLRILVFTIAGKLVHVGCSLQVQFAAILYMVALFNRAAIIGGTPCQENTRY